MAIMAIDVAALEGLPRGRMVAPEREIPQNSAALRHWEAAARRGRWCPDGPPRGAFSRFPGRVGVANGGCLADGEGLG